MSLQYLSILRIIEQLDYSELKLLQKYINSQDLYHRSLSTAPKIKFALNSGVYLNQISPEALTYALQLDPDFEKRCYHNRKLKKDVKTRTDPILIQILETLKDKANDYLSKWRIVQIPNCISDIREIVKDGNPDSSHYTDEIIKSEYEKYCL